MTFTPPFLTPRSLPGRAWRGREGEALGATGGEVQAEGGVCVGEGKEERREEGERRRDEERKILGGTELIGCVEGRERWESDV